MLTDGERAGAGRTEGWREREVLVDEGRGEQVDEGAEERAVLTIGGRAGAGRTEGRREGWCWRTEGMQEQADAGGKGREQGAEGRVVGPADKGAVRGGLLTEIYTDKYSATGDNNGGGHWEEGNWLMTGVLTTPFYTDISYV